MRKIIGRKFHGPAVWRAAILATCALIPTATLLAQDGDRVTVPFSDPSAPKRVQCSVIQGSITVKTHSAREAIIEATARGGRGRSGTPPPGMRRIGNSASGLNVEESGNLIKISTFPASTSEITIYVPADTSLKLNAANNGSINVEGVSGEIDVSNLNGHISITNVSGAVVANTLNGKLVVSMNQVTPNKAMSFSTLNGDVDVTLPADVKANLKMKTDHGDIFSDFEITLKSPSPPQPTTEASGDKKRYKVRFDRSMFGTIGGGGPDMSFSTLNGTIYIRKKK